MLQDVYYEQTTNQTIVSDTTEYYVDYDNRSTVPSAYDDEQGIFVHW